MQKSDFKDLKMLQILLIIKNNNIINIEEDEKIIISI